MALTYYPDSEPGFSRRRCGRGFSYLAPDGTRVGDEDVIHRLKALAVPPAYSDVWMSPLSNGHLQASGRDARRRKQYRYHPDWAQQRALKKFDQLAAFGEALPRIRRWIATRLQAEPGTLDAAVAAALALLDRASMRIGAPEYTAENGSFGATTLRPRHVRTGGAGIELCYTAKGGAKVRKTLTGARLAQVLEACQDLPGAELLSFGETGARLRSDHVQDVLDDLTGQSVTPKTFRTWNGTHAAFVAASGGAVTIKAMAEAAAERLHNTPKIARDSYIHPKVIALAENGDAASLEPDTPAGYRKGELALLKLLSL